MSEKPPPILTVDLKGNGGIIHFQTLDEIESWLNTEKSFWQWIHTSFPPDALWDGYTNKHRQIENLRNLITDIRKHPGDTARQKNLLEQIRTVLESHYSTGKLIYSSTPKGHFVNQLLQQTNSMEARWALLYLATPEDFLPSSKYLSGITKAVIFEKALDESRADAELKSLEQLREQWQTHLSTYKAEQDGLQNRFEELNDAVGNLHEAQKKEHETNLQKHNESIATLLTDGRTKLEEIQKTYNEYMAVKGPVEYWVDQQKIHQGKVTRFSRITCIFGFAGTLILV